MADESKRKADGASAAGAATVATGQLTPGLYLVATPIGNAQDLTLRARDVLMRADVLAAEDTRRTRQLLTIHGIALGARPLLPYADHNGAAQRPKLMAHLAQGARLAYCSDAGTPLIADPGYRLVEAAHSAGVPVIALPGPSALTAALAVAGLPTDRVYFGGFLPPKAGARRRALESLAGLEATLVFFESPRRIGARLAECAEILGADRPAVVLRELTKLHEERVAGPLGALAARYAAEEPRGEIVFLVAAGSEPTLTQDTLDAALEAALAETSLKEAVRDVAEALGLPRKTVYARALALREH